MSVVKFELGKLIKNLREAKGWTQAYLCYGDTLNPAQEGAICSVDELSRIENGKRRPHWNTFERLLQRLGEDPSKYYRGYALTPKDKELVEKKNKLKFLTRKNDAESIATAEALISELEQDVDFNKDELNVQFLLCNKAILAHFRKDYQVMYDTAYEGIKITKPSFDESKIDTYALFYVEIALVNQIAISHAFISSLSKSSEIFSQIKTCLDNGYVDEDENSKIYMQVLFNLSNMLGQLGRYDECLPICETGLDYCDKYDNSLFQPRFLCNKGCCLLGLNKKKEGIAILKDAYAFLRLSKRFNELSAITAYVESTFEIKIDAH